MNQSVKIVSLVVLVAAIVIAAMTLFTISETQRGLVLRFGKIIRAESDEIAILQPGLHAKFPIIDTVVILDPRIQTLDIKASRIPTEEKKELIVDLFTKWQIEDFPLFYTSTGGDKRRAEQLLREKLVDGLRGELGRRKLNDVVSQDRQKVMDKISADTNVTAKSIGVKIIDARIMRIDLPQEVSDAVFNLMRTERQRVAGEHRAQGRARAEAIRANADARSTVIQATAVKQSNQLRGEGEALAAQIYASSYGQDPEFYSFYRSLEAYQQTFNGNNDMLVVSPDDAFFKYFKSIQGTTPKAESAKS